MKYKKRKLIKKMKQTGNSNIGRDKKYKSLKPGKRISASGGKYTETRANRSDVRERI